MRSDDLTAATDLTPLALLPLLLVGGSELCADANTLGVVNTILDVVTAVAPPLIYLYCVLVWRGIFGAFRKHTYELRAGKYFFVKRMFREEVCGFDGRPSTLPHSPSPRRACLRWRVGTLASRSRTARWRCASCLASSRCCCHR